MANQVRCGKRQESRQDAISDENIKRGIRNTVDKTQKMASCDWNDSKCPVLKVGKDFKTFRHTTPSSVGQVRKE